MDDVGSASTAPRGDRGTVAAWAARIAAGDLAPVQSVFRGYGADGPYVFWPPFEDQLGSAQLRFLMRHWSELAGGRSMPGIEQIDPLAMRPALGYVALLDVVEDGWDFRYRVFGSVLAAVSEFDMTRRLLSAMKASPYIVNFALAVYRAALLRGQPLFTRHSPPAAVSGTVWHRLVLPLAGADGSVVRFLTGNMPTSRTGRPIALRF